MSAYELKLHVGKDSFGGVHTHISVRDPFWPEKETLAISPDCVSEVEINYEIDRLKKALDEAGKAAKRHFAAVRRERQTATS